MKIPYVSVNKILVARIIVVAAIVFFALWGIGKAFHLTASVVSERLDRFSVNRVEAKGLIPETQVVKEVPVLKESDVKTQIDEALKANLGNGL